MHLFRGCLYSIPCSHYLTRKCQWRLIKYNIFVLFVTVHINGSKQLNGKYTNLFVTMDDDNICNKRLFSNELRGPYEAAHISFRLCCPLPFQSSTISYGYSWPNTCLHPGQWFTMFCFTRKKNNITTTSFNFPSHFLTMSFSKKKTVDKVKLYLLVCPGKLPPLVCCSFVCCPFQFYHCPDYKLCSFVCSEVRC
jgi:hypothetical protein